MYLVFFRHRQDSPSQVVCNDDSLKDLVFLLETSEHITEYIVFDGPSRPSASMLGKTTKLVWEFDYQKEW